MKKLGTPKTCTELFSADLLAVRERAADGLAETEIGMRHGLVDDGIELLYVDPSVRENALLRRDVHDLADETAALSVRGLHPALECKGKLGEKRRVNAFRGDGGPSAFFYLILFLCAADDADVIGGCHGRGGCNAHGEGAALQKVFRRLMVLADADGDLRLLADAAPRGVHRIRCSVLCVGAEDQDGHRVQPGLCSKAFSHFRLYR